MSGPSGSAASPAGAATGLLAEPGRVWNEVVVHPLVLLSAVDHHYRVARDAVKKRVVGVLLGEAREGRVDVTNSFAVPFEEDAKDPSIYFLDHDYLESMYYMHKKISAREKIVGFYSTAAKLKPADLHIDALLRRLPFVQPNPVLTLIDVRPDIEGLPVQAYQTVETVLEGKENVRTFVHIGAEVGAYEAEEVGVEHLLRDINDPSVSTLAADLRHKLNGLKGLAASLADISAYLDAVVKGSLPINNDILAHVQTILATLPNVRVEAVAAALVEATNDDHLIMYVAALSRSVMALHDLVNNKLKFAGEEESGEKGKDKEAGATGGEAAAGDAGGKANEGKKDKEESKADKK